MYTRKILLIMICWLFFLPTQVQCKSVKIAMYKLSPFISPDLKDNGFVADIIIQAFEKAGYNVYSKLTSWPRALNHMEKGSMDVMTNLFYTEERATKFGYPKNHLATMMYVFYVNKNKMDIPENITLEHLKKMRVGLVKRASYSERFDKIIPELENVYYGIREIHMIQMVIADRLDVVPSSFYGGMHQLINEAKGMEQKVKRIHSDFFDRKKLFPVFSKKNPDHSRLIHDFDAQMEKMKKDGSLKRIYAKHNKPYF